MSGSGVWGLTLSPLLMKPFLSVVRCLSHHILPRWQNFSSRIRYQGGRKQRVKWIILRNSNHLFSFYLYRTIIGVVCKDGILLASEKVRISDLLVENTNPRNFTIDKGIGMVIYNLLWIILTIGHYRSSVVRFLMERTLLTEQEKKLSHTNRTTALISTAS